MKNEAKEKINAMGNINERFKARQTELNAKRDHLLAEIRRVKEERGIYSDRVKDTQRARDAKVFMMPV